MEGVNTAQHVNLFLRGKWRDCEGAALWTPHQRLESLAGEKWPIRHGRSVIVYLL